MITPRTVVIYHKDCPDGAMSAAVAWTQLGATATYLARTYGDGSDKDWAAFAGFKVIFVDFSWPREAILALATVATEVVVLDHHKTAQAALAGIPLHAAGRCPINIVFDMKQCGAVLTWRYFAPDAEVPLLLQYVQDRDLWDWKLPASREVAAAAGTWPRTIDGAREIMHAFDFEKFVQIGERVLAYQRNLVEKLAELAVVQDLGVVDLVPTLYLPAETGLQSEVCEEMLSRFPTAPFSACYSDWNGRRRWSLRSRPDKDGVVFDVGALAVKRGGGGHVQAAGFTEPTP